MKHDLERLGYFQVPSYLNIDDPYIDQNKVFLNSSNVKGRQLYGKYSKSKCGLNDGYFSDFCRVFSGEAITDLAKLKHRERIKEKLKRLGSEFIPSGGSKFLLGTGSYWGTFSKSPVYFSSQMVQPVSNYQNPRNIYTNPGKKGTGSGYVGVTIGKYPNYSAEPYVDQISLCNSNKQHRRCLLGRREFIQSGRIDFFSLNPYKQSHRFKYSSNNKLPKTKTPSIHFRLSNPAKRDGGMKAGTFNPFPNHISEPYVDQCKLNKAKRDENKVFLPPSGSKSTRFESIISCNVRKTINNLNHKLVTSLLYPEVC